MNNTKSVRPFHLMCLFCRIGRGEKLDLPQSDKVEELLEYVRSNPQGMLELNCNCSNVYSVQNPGTRDDVGGSLLNKRRDLMILRFLKMTPGQAKPADDLIEQIAEAIKTPKYFCSGQGCDAWEGCPYASSGYYEMTCRVPYGRMVLPQPSPEQRCVLKERDVDMIASAKKLRIRPHHLLCMCCFYGRGIIEGNLKPIDEDNLCEVIYKMQQNPDIPVELVEGCCMICPPCTRYQQKTNWCLGGGMALRDETKDLEVLYKLNLKYGDVLPAAKLYAMLFEKVAHLHEICRFTANLDTNGRPGFTHEWRPCADLFDSNQIGEAAYEIARRDGMGIVNK